MALRIRRSRRQRYTEFKLHKPRWVDPYPGIPGTEPEKRLFAVLVRRGYFFIFQGQVRELTRGIYVTMAIPGYKPDFILPEYKVIIDPFSEYHHSLPGAVERDIRKIALYRALGYSYYHPWAGEVIENAEAVVDSIRELQGKKKAKLTARQKRLAKWPGYELGPFLGAGAFSVGAANRRRRRSPALTLRVGSRRQSRGRTLGG